MNDFIARGPRRFGWWFALFFALLCCGTAWSQVAALQRGTDLRADKLPSAAVIASLPAATSVQVIGIEGGWAQVEVADDKSPGARKSGWVRAGSLDLAVASSGAASVANGRTGSNIVALSLGVRGLGARSNRHALLIGVGHPADAGALPGVRFDRDSATQIALAMQVPRTHIRTLDDDEASADGIRQAIAALGQGVGEGDRVFVYFSGYGTRTAASDAAACSDALVAEDGGAHGAITLAELASLLKPISDRTDKLLLMVDAGFAEGAVDAGGAAGGDGFVNANDEGALRSRFLHGGAGCAATTAKRNLQVVAGPEPGAFAPPLIVLDAGGGRVAYDDAQKGGLATEFLRDCLLRDAHDLDGSGAVSVDALRQCTQGKLDQRLRGDARLQRELLAASGNTAFVPVWSGAAPARNEAAAPAISGAQALAQLFDQRDARRSVQVRLGSDHLRVQQDALDFTVSSDRPGYVYVAMAGSDNQSLQLLFPNDLDRDNRIAAGQPMALPHPTWRAKAGGPEGTDTLLVIVADGPRDLAGLGAKAGPFISSLNDAGGRAQLGALMSRSRGADAQACATAAAAGRDPACSDAYGAALLSVQEIR